MAILAIPLVTSILKPHKPHLSFLFTTRRSAPVILRNRFFSKTRASSFVSSSSFSTARDSSAEDPNSQAVKKSSIPTFQQAIQRLQEYWASVGCAIMQCSNTEVGAGTMNPLTFLRVLGPEPWNVAERRDQIPDWRKESLSKGRSDVCYMWCREFHGHCMACECMDEDINFNCMCYSTAK